MFSTMRQHKKVALFEVTFKQIHTTFQQRGFLTSQTTPNLLHHLTQRKYCLANTPGNLSAFQKVIQKLTKHQAAVKTVITWVVMPGFAAYGGLYYERKKSPVYSEAEALEKIDLEDKAAAEEFERKLNSTFSVGQFTSIIGDYINREEERERLKSLLKEEPDGDYIVLAGPHKCGKTMLMYEAVNELKRDNVCGIIYLGVVREEPIAVTIATALSLNHIAVLNPQEAEASRHQRAKERAFNTLYKLSENPVRALGQIQDCLSRNAKQFSAEDQPQKKRVTTIVIDSINKLLPKDRPPNSEEKQQLLALQEVAKELADNRSVRMIFIDSSGAALAVMNESSSRSRMNLVIAEDVVNAKEYLRNKLEGTNMNYESAYNELTGNRLHLLKDIVKLAQKKGLDGQLLSKEEVRSTFLQEHGYNVLINCFLEQPPHDSESLKTQFQRKILQTLINNSQGVPLSNIPRPRGLSDQEYNSAIADMIQKDIIRYVGVKEIAFHSQAVKTAAKEPLTIAEI